MLDPRIYRTALALVALAVLVLAFSLTDQQGPIGTTLAPDAFNGQNAYAAMNGLAAKYPQRRPGSAADLALATRVAQKLSSYGFAVSARTFTGRTVDGSRRLENVTGELVGMSSGSIVIVAQRDALGSPATAELSGTAVLLELARALSGETHHRSIVLASTSGSTGAAGPTQLARSLGRPVDAVVVLGDLAGARVREPIVVPWSSGAELAPPMLRNTVAAAVAAQAGLRPGGASLASQFVHLAFPLSVSDQAPFDARGVPAALLSVSGERDPSSHEPVDPARITALGRSVLQTISALDTGPSVPRPSDYLLWEGKVVPSWAIALLVLALILPVLGATIDALARARRRHHSISRWVTWVLLSAVPFLLAALVVLGARLVGLIQAAPPGAVGASAVPLRGGGIALLVALPCVIALAFVAVRRVVISFAIGPRSGDEPSFACAGVAVLLVMCAVSLAIWVANPFAAALIVPALHLWMWVVDPQARLRPELVVALLLAGLAPPVFLAVYYWVTLGLGPVAAAWNGVLLVAGGHVGMLAAVEWSVMLGCVVSVLSIAVRMKRERRPEAVPITVRGPITYGGPGSLGGTESAIRR